MSSSVLVVGNYRPTVAVVRSLGRAGYRVIVGREANGYIADLSRYASETWEHPPIKEQEAAFIDALASFLTSRTEIGVLFPVSGLAIMALCRHRGRVPANVRIAMPDPAVVEACDHKTMLLEAARRLGIPHPAFALAADPAALTAAASEVGYPCVVKPMVAEQRLFGEKAVICVRPEDLERAFRTWPEGHGSLLVQRYATGIRHNLHLAARDGRILRCLDSLSLRTQRADGTGLTVEAVSVPVPEDLRRHCSTLLRELSYTGIACVQFIQDQKDGATAFLEINPRLAAGYAIAQHCGLDLPVLAVKLALGEPIEERDDRADYVMSARYAWTYGDLKGLKHALRHRKVDRWGAVKWLSAAGLNLLRADIHATWSWTDPRPALALCAQTLKGAGGADGAEP